ncbi:metalloendopeptidase-like membrane protein [Mycobacteroides abscessus subsp. abscessus]|uniref:peptidoglycan recognition protein family protein n=1 Tax=Mycobacteroides abscessus TaxID=36809 RepID=UPI00092C98FB|nr:N-acetylmuramoyl-L-alanine amidase [Mycobacteroides abscessus]SHT15057.1 metalloendopeptidase-like membrane protein [Mycobacteroides abscessus subsp. abscessus]SIA22263.1 metalloendopeptidase-like membrane protein [Mycobacteroides abscessus subsp. abscessus]SID49531.1 metalloendopeptidase-like membrane protein [Mycobacteroides abscessus subsp. abscessus]SIF20485.1 metalloendopeptidase-like membrane protein [Mycobacteroides abscessus subsp. abscessus]SII24557.1 metalloendopeptidase-like memb
MVTTKDQVAQLIVSDAKARGYTRDECLAVKSTLYQESEWDETVWDPTYTTFGVAQQDASYPDRFKGAAAQVKGFFDKLDIWRRKPGASSNIWLNIAWMQQAPNWPSAQYWYEHGRRAYLTEIKSHIATVTPYLDKYWPTTGGNATVPDENRPDFNEFGLYSPNNQSRGATKIDAFFLHTQEGGGGDSAAEDLAKYLGNPANQVSYHYAISQASDSGVTVVDVVDTDKASWSVLSANNRSINLCFAGSRASWTREQWMKQANALDVAAYLAVQDCEKYDIPAKVIAPPYSGRIPGISDHRYVTKVLGDGTHTDVGDGFPWDYFTERVTFWAGGGQAAPPTTGKQYPKDYSDRELQEAIALDVREIRTQLGAGLDQWGEDGDLGRNAQGQRRTLRAGLAALMRKVGA